jgi:hypothetical protein
LIINEKGEPSLKKLRVKATPANLAQLEEALQEKIPERHLLDVLARINHVTGFTRHFGPLSGTTAALNQGQLHREGFSGSVVNKSSAMKKLLKLFHF